MAQAPNPTSATNPFWGSVTAQPVTGKPLKLSLDDAMQRGLKNNLGLKEAENGEKTLHGEKNEALQVFLPTITLDRRHRLLHARSGGAGIRAQTIKKFTSARFPGASCRRTFADYARHSDRREDSILRRSCFPAPVIAGLKAAGAAERSAYFAKMTARGEVVQQVATAYLRAMADAERSGECEGAGRAGAGAARITRMRRTRRARGRIWTSCGRKVQLQSQQQALIAAQNQQAKDLILLKREIGIDPGTGD